MNENQEPYPEQTNKRTTGRVGANLVFAQICAANVGEPREPPALPNIASWWAVREPPLPYVMPSLPVYNHMTYYGRGERNALHTHHTSLHRPCAPD